MTGESLIAASRTAVWAALTDPGVLGRCIDGVETLAATTDDAGATRFDGRMNARVGPVRATFAGGVTLTEVDAPNRYVIVGEGKGAVARIANGTAEVRLSDADLAGQPATRLAYTVSSSVGGKLAQLGARLIEGTARGYAEPFFTRLKAEVEAPVAAAMPDATAAADPAPNAAPDPATSEINVLHDNRRRTGLTPLVWCSLVIVVVIAILAWELL